MNKKAIRHENIILFLSKSTVPVSGSELAKRFGVSRQIIVTDINTLRADGYEIVSMHEGYLLESACSAERIFKLRHTSAQTQDELTSIVALGGVVVDVYVWHRVYGRIKANLNIATQEDIETFVDNIQSGKSSELMHVTSGYHYHTVRAADEEILDRIEQVLNEKGYIVPEISNEVQQKK